MCSEKISVIIPVYNTEKYVEKAVRSVMDQTYRNLEIICVNDGSSDSSGKILHRLQQEDPRIIIIEKENGGLGDARNAGLAKATSEWISFLDSDDTIQPTMYEKISNAFPYNPDIIVFGIRITHEEGAIAPANDKKYYSIKYSGEIEINDTVIKYTDGSVANKLFRKSILNKYNIHFEKIYYEDFPFTLQYFCCIHKAYYFKDKLYNYLRRPGSIMAETFNSTPKAIDHLQAIDCLFAFLEKHNLLTPHEPLLSRFFNNCFWLSIKYIVPDKRQDVIDFADSIYGKYSFLHNYLVRKEQNGTILYGRIGKKHLPTVMLEALLSVKKEHIDYKPYKIVRLFNIIIYKKPIKD